MDSNYYITIRRFIHVFQSKVLGIPDEECINQYKTAKDDKKSGVEYCMAAGEATADKMLVASADFSGNEIPEQEEENEADGQTEEVQSGEEEQQENNASGSALHNLSSFLLL